SMPFRQPVPCHNPWRKFRAERYCFRPQKVHGYSIAGICLIRLKHVRPGFLPACVGISSENAAHRIAVEWDNDNGVRTGVFIPRRDTSVWLNAFARGRLFPGVHHCADFEIQETLDHYENWCA
ncbi:MAG: hypothetical protein O3B13_07415, partial [Planctomycetota bacterium]|nr:hypothetical protein [Planctomycetota bacterium]